MFAAALTIALIAIGLLTGWLGSSGSVSESEQYWATTGPISIREQVQRGGTIYLSLFNRETSWLAVNSITVGNATAPIGVRLNSGESKTVAVSGLRPCSSDYDSYVYDAVLNLSSLDISGQLQRGAKPLAGKCERA